MSSTYKPILFTEEKRLDLTDYGIQIPLRGSRAGDILRDLEGNGYDRALIGQEVIDRVIALEDVARVHTPAYSQLLFSEDPSSAVLDAYELVMPDGSYHRYEPTQAIRPFSDLIQRSILEASGTLKACEMSLSQGFCHFLGGGMHHAMAHRGRGFCLMHDVMISVRRLQSQGDIKHVWVIDTDAHKGDGTAALAIADEFVHTLSIHMAKGWPLNEEPLDKKGHLKRPFFPSTVDCPVPLGADDHYLSILQGGLQRLKSLSPVERPDLAVVVAGSDPSALDILPSAGDLQLTLPQMLSRDRLVYEYLLDLDIPQAWVMAGGYGDDVWRVHSQFLRSVLRERF